VSPADPYEGAFFTPSGGAVWHWRALWRQQFWNGFRQELANALAGWQPPSDRLLLMGPSAGWCIPSEFLSRFRIIDAIDIDPAASVLFRFNHGKALARSSTALYFHKVNLFNALTELLNRFPDHAILFTNVLGQHLFHENDPNRAKAQLDSLKSDLAGRHWASFHDRLSGAFPIGKALPASRTDTQSIDSAELASQLGLSGQWLDHLTAHILPDGIQRRTMAWPLLKDWLHIVEFGFVEPQITMAG
jgi:hypothetical protein